MDLPVVLEVLPLQRPQEGPQLVQDQQVEGEDGAGPALLRHRRVDLDTEVSLAAPWVQFNTV